MRRLACVAAFSTLLVSTHADAMSYGLVPFQDGSTAVVARGQIQDDESERLLSFLASVGGTPGTLIISSPGGNMVSALELGVTLRRLGIRTMVGSVAQDPHGGGVLAPGSCHSACVLVLMAGVSRQVMPGSRVGVHSPQVLLVSRGRAYRLDDATTRYMVQGTEPALRSYARRMGVSPAVIDLAHGVPHTSIRTLSPAELARLGLVTGARRRADPAASRPRAKAAQRGRTPRRSGA